VKNFELNIEGLALEQYQSTGFLFFNHLKNILVSFIAAYEVVNGHITLVTLLSISYIIGQTNAPIEQLVGFITSAQDARMCMERLQEINDQPGEDELETSNRVMDTAVLNDDIILENVSFQYEGPDSPEVIKNLSITIPKGRITAIVGSSGSGKTTLLKLLLKYYEPTQGDIYVGEQNLQNFAPKVWRKHCGTVMQDNFIFDDTIESNVALGSETIDVLKLNNALKTANLSAFVDALPLKQKTKIGSSGIGLSGGEKQRLQIARAVYKGPQFIIFDEATSSLDANNEKIIIDNLTEFFKDKTVVIVAHRLSTVKNAVRLSS
jgi:ATP-binding cassette subfamily B protein